MSVIYIIYIGIFNIRGWIEKFAASYKNNYSLKLLLLYSLILL